MSLFDPVPDVLDVTLRDGSYAHDFQFTAEDTANLVAALESCGFRWIEVGHGLGLSASDRGRRRANTAGIGLREIGDRFFEGEACHELALALEEEGKFAQASAAIEVRLQYRREIGDEGAQEDEEYMERLATRIAEH